MRTLPALATIVALTGVTACTPGDAPFCGDSNVDRRIGPFLEVSSQSTLAPIDGTSLRLYGEYTLEATPDPNQRRARLTGWGGSREDHDIVIDLVATQALDRAPLGQRYLTADDFEHIELTLSRDGRDGVRSTAIIQRIELRLDVLLRILHATLEVRFPPTDADGEPIDLRVALTGYLEFAGCTTERDAYPDAHLDVCHDNPTDAPAACIELFDQLRATPTDPDFPPAPYDLYADDTPEGGGGSTPVLSFD